MACPLKNPWSTNLSKRTVGQYTFEKYSDTYTTLFLPWNTQDQWDAQSTNKNLWDIQICQLVHQQAVGEASEPGHVTWADT